MTRNLNRALPLACALTLAGSALLAGGGGALADKATPQISGADGAKCTPSSVDKSRYHTWVHLDGKGRWGFVTVTLERASGAQEFYVDPPLKVRLAPEQYIEVTATGAPEAATMTVTVTSRKGVPDQEESVTTPLFCD